MYVSKPWYPSEILQDLFEMKDIRLCHSNFFSLLKGNLVMHFY